jgi:hypothetical protein
LLVVSEPQTFVTFRLTLYVPAVVKVKLGFCAVLLPSPEKSQDQVKGSILAEVSMKYTGWFAHTVAGSQTKSAVGLGQAGSK